MLLQHAAAGHGDSAGFLRNDDRQSVGNFTDAYRRTVTGAQIFGKAGAVGHREDAARRSDLTLLYDDSAVMERSLFYL